ncbi:MAG: type II toxin-antitoxin system Phd/YefM family antitoxin [Oscillospiraceae bacterium]|nr:type II toxin-antitoxin system Phd/YefM family antitoxin [Oscillospiraceae bacterium]
MNMVRPLTDLQSNLNEISQAAHETGKPIILTENGYGNLVVLSMKAYEDLRFDNEVYYKLLEAELEEEKSNLWYTSDDILKSAKEITGCTD